MYRRWHKHYDHGVPYTLPFPRLMPKDYFSDWVQKQPEKEYLIYGDRHITYKEADSIACRLANSLIDLGYEKHDRIAIMTPNIPEYVLAVQTCFKINAIIVPTNPASAVGELIHQFNDSGVTTVVVVDAVASKVIEIMKLGKTGIKRVIVISSQSDYPESSGVFDFYRLVAKGIEREPEFKTEYDDIGILQYTGGTTGVPKGCVLTNANIEAMAWIVWYWCKTPLRPLNKAFRSLVALPIYHIYSFNVHINLNLIDGGTLIMVDNPITDNLIKNVNKHKPNFFFAVPAMLIGINNNTDTPCSKIQSLQGVVCGSAPLSINTINTFEKMTGAQLCEGYGMSEATGTICVNPFNATKPGTVGLPLPETDVRIVDLETGTKDVSMGQAGELICKGPQVMNGYWNNPEETASVIKNGWLYTGDIASMDEDGYITILDRKKDMCLCSGFNVFPREIDEVLYSHPKVLAACSVGIPDPKRGETIKSFIVLKPGETMTEQKVIEYCKQYLIPYKIPTTVEFIRELPCTSVGKPMRMKLRKMEGEKILKTTG